MTVSLCETDFVWARQSKVSSNWSSIIIEYLVNQRTCLPFDTSEERFSAAQCNRQSPALALRTEYPHHSAFYVSPAGTDHLLHWWWNWWTHSHSPESFLWRPSRFCHCSAPSSSWFGWCSQLAGICVWTNDRTNGSVRIRELFRVRTLSLILIWVINYLTKRISLHLSCSLSILLPPVGGESSSCWRFSLVWSSESESSTKRTEF